jgi:hypothetical protein
VRRGSERLKSNCEHWMEAKWDICPLGTSLIPWVRVRHTLWFAL